MNIKKSLNRILAFPSLLLLVIAAIATLLISAPVEALPTRPVGSNTNNQPQPVDQDPSSNMLWKTGKYCSGMDESTGTYDTCANYEKQLEAQLGCTGLFFSDGGKWYLKPGAYADCYQRAAAQVKLLKDKCNPVKNDTDEWDLCEENQGHLNIAMGCDSRIFQRDGSNWKLKPGSFSACEDRLNAVGSLKLVGSNGQVSAQAVSAITPTGGGNSNDDDQVNCDANESPLSWIACPLIDAGAGMTDYIFNNFVQPLLENVPISADSKDGSFLAWQTFRIFGNAILVGSLLVMVFAQNFGRFVDAYTIRKMAPRIVVGAIAINISFYLCLAAIDIVNVIGNGLHQALTAPFIDENTFKEGIPIDDTAANNITGVLGAGLLAAGAGVIFGTVATIGALGIISLMLPLIISVALVSLAVLFTIIIRQALLIFLTAISAVAIACFILPGTEKYFRQWWDLFLKTLMVYPIIAIIFAMSNIMASIILRSAGGGVLGTAQVITAILAVYAPLVLIPFAFKFAGGAIGNLMDIAGKRAQGIAARTSEAGPIKGRRERARRDFEGGVIQRRADMADSLKGRASSGSAAKKRLYRGLAGAVGGYNIEAQASAFRAARAKELNDQIATGRDEEIRGLTVNKQWALNQGKEGTDWRMENGQRQFRSLGGAWVNEADVDAGYNRWGNDTFAQQAALSYEMRKAMTDEEVGRISSNYANVATGAGGWGNSETQARGGFIGAAFENQNQHLEFKYTDAMTGQLKAEEFTKEIYEKRGSYPLAQMSAHTFKQLQNAYDAAPEDSATRNNIKAVAETFMTRYGGGGGGVAGMEGENPITRGMVGGSRPAGEGSYQVNSAGAAHVSEAVRDLAEHVGVYGPTKNNPPQN